MYNSDPGDALHRQESTLKNSKPTMIESRKTQLNLNAVNTSREAFTTFVRAIGNDMSRAFSRPQVYAFA
jgi:hypothetical protein